MMDDHGIKFDFHRKNNENKSITAEFQIKSDKHKVFFRSDQAVLSGTLESFLAGIILPCMKRDGGRLRADGEISEKFMSGLSTIQNIYSMWDPTLQKVRVENTSFITGKVIPKKRVGLFFSGGVDSFYTFLKHKDEITDLIFVHGFDIQLSDILLREKVSKKIREVASSFNKNCIEIETNLREVLDTYVSWGKQGHGPALASVAHLLSPLLNRVYIATSNTYLSLGLKWGSHPILDHLWSSESLEFIHDGCEATRVEKVSLISEYDIALQSLRVCWKNPNSVYNCGRCEKCLRTMISLKINNALNRCTTFDEPLDIRRVYKMPGLNEDLKYLIKDNLDAMEVKPGNEDLKKALRYLLNRPAWPGKIRTKIKKLKQFLKQ